MASLHALECFLTVLEAGSMSRAAERLHLSQPALSQQIAGLEREVGTALFERLPRGVRPTSAATEMAGEAAGAVRSAKRSVEIARAVAAGTHGRLRVGVAETLTSAVLAPALGGWLASHPAVSVLVEEMVSAEALLDALAHGQLDAVILPDVGTDAGEVTRLGEEEIVVAMPARHRLATRRRPPNLAEIAAEPLIHLSPANGLRAWLDDRAAARGVRLDPAVETRGAGSAALLAASGLGVAVLPLSAVPAAFPGVVRRLSPRLRREIAAVSAGSADALVAGFVAHLATRPLALLAEDRGVA